MLKKYIVISETSVGCTFLDWSIHYLSGAEKFFSLEHGSIPLTDTPLSSEISNAHQHKKNHPLGVNETRAAMDVLDAVTDHSIVSMYPWCVTHDSLASKGRDIHTTETYRQILQDTGGYSPDYIDNILRIQRQDFANIWDECLARGYAVIYVKNTSHPMYDYLAYTRTKRPLDASNVPLYFLKIFFAKEIASQNFDIDNASAWDLREFIALNVNATRPHIWDTDVDFKKPHHFVDSQELWGDALTVISYIMNELGIAILEERLDHWQQVYTMWQQRQAKILKLPWTITRICESIVAGHYYDLRKHNLTLWDESLILSVLLRKYNVNLKAWGMSKFPDNTLQLHDLIEPSTHQLV